MKRIVLVVALYIFFGSFIGESNCFPLNFIGLLANLDRKEQEKKLFKSLKKAIKYGRAAEIQELLKKIDINKKDKKGNTLLHYAVRLHKPEMVKLLIAKGADLKAKNVNGSIVLHIASATGDLVKVMTVAKLCDF